MGLSNDQQAIFVAVGAGALAVEGVLATANIDPTIKIYAMVITGAIGAAAFAIKEALGGKAPSANPDKPQ